MLSVWGWYLLSLHILLREDKGNVPVLFHLSTITVLLPLLWTNCEIPLNSSQIETAALKYGCVCVAWLTNANSLLHIHTCSKSKLEIFFPGQFILKSTKIYSFLGISSEDLRGCQETEWAFLFNNSIQEEPLFANTFLPKWWVSLISATKLWIST